MTRQSHFISFSTAVVVLLLFSHTNAFQRPWWSKAINLFARRDVSIGGTPSSLDWLTFNSLPTKVAPSSEKQKTKKSKMRNFKRTNRVDGQEKWMRELFLYKSQLEALSAPAKLSGCPVLIVELAKELLYSGIPEQVLELYAAYYDIIVCPSTESQAVSVNVLPVTPDPKLVLVATRAFIALGDIRGALQLLQATSRAGLDFDAESKSLLMADLAKCSPEGLQAALRLRTSMRERRERINAEGFAGLLRGVLMHGINVRRPSARLLVDPSKEEKALAEERGSGFRISLAHGLELAVEIANEFMFEVPEAPNTAMSQNASASSSSSSSTSSVVPPTGLTKQRRKHASTNMHKVMDEVLRIVFRVGSAASKAKLDRNFEVDVRRDREERSRAGLAKAMEVIVRYNLPFDVQTADVLVDESLRIGDVDGVKFVAKRMWEGNIYAHTDTFNALLRRYADNGDGESAYRLVREVMEQGDSTKPNVDSWVLLLRSCLRSSRGRYFARKVIDQRRGTTSITDENNNNGNSGECVETKQTTHNNTSTGLIAGGAVTIGSSVNASLSSSPQFTHQDQQPQRQQLSKAEWDCWLELQVLDKQSFWPVLAQMVKEGSQPDDQTMMTLFQALGTSGDKEGALRLYRLQVEAEERRCSFRNEVMRVGLSAASLSKASSTSLSSSSIPMTSLDDVADLGLFLPPPSRRSVHRLMEILSDGSDESCKDVLAVLTDVCRRARAMGAPFDREGQKINNPLSGAVLPVSLTASGRRILAAQFSPDETTFALAIEVCVAAKQPAMALHVFAEMEEWGLRPDRRVYAALIRAFGIAGDRGRDVASALGVFNEMRCNFVPDVANLQSILEVCMEDVLDLRLLCPVLEHLVDDDGCNLEVYSKDILMQGFPDAVSLGKALEMMEREPFPEGYQCVSASLDVIAVLVQAARRAIGVDAMVEAMALLGRAGIRPDRETMEYFRIPDAPLLGSPNSRHHNRLLVPHRERVRSLMDIDMPSDLAPDLSLPVRNSAVKGGGEKVEPYFETGDDDWKEHAGVLKNAILGADGPFDDHDDDDANDDVIGSPHDIEEDEEEALAQFAANAERALLTELLLGDKATSDADVDVKKSFGATPSTVGVIDARAPGLQLSISGREIEKEPLEISETFFEQQARPRTQRRAPVKVSQSQSQSQPKGTTAIHPNKGGSASQSETQIIKKTTSSGGSRNGGGVERRRKSVDGRNGRTSSPPR